MELKHGELTGTVRQTAFEVHRYFRNGFLEKVYENALAHRLRKKGLEVNQQVPMPVFDEDGTKVGVYYADLLIEEKLVVEIKAIKALGNEHFAQLMNYLKASGKEVGLLINFGAKKIEFRRCIYTQTKETSASSVSSVVKE